MVRWGVLVAGTVAVMAAAFVAGAAAPSKEARPPAEARAEAAKAVVVGQKTGYFNMAKVMREYKRAKSGVDGLNVRRQRMAANLVGLRSMYAELLAASKAEADPARKQQFEDDVLRIARQVEDMDRSLNRILNDKATTIITELYDEIYAAVAAVARDNGLSAVIAYPDAVTPEERENPQIKELKLKPPAAQPFYVEPSVDYSDEILRRLNEKFDAERRD